MKAIFRLLAPLTFALGLPTFAWAACADLSGTYACEYDDTVLEMELSQSITNGITTYVFDGAESIADGNRHDLPDEGRNQNRHYTATCDSTYLTIDLRGDLVSSSGKYGSFEIQQILSLTPSVDLNTVDRGILKLDSGERYPLYESNVCRRI